MVKERNGYRGSMDGLVRKGCNRLYLSVLTTLSENIMSDVHVAGVASERTKEHNSTKDKNIKGR